MDHSEDLGIDGRI